MFFCKQSFISCGFLRRDLLPFDDGLAANVKAPARRSPGGRIPLFFQEQIKGPKNASIARFDGIGCYQTDSEISGCLMAFAAA